MQEIHIEALRAHPERKEPAAAWFHEKRGVPLEAYLESISDCLRQTQPVPQWYPAFAEGRIAGERGCQRRSTPFILTVDWLGWLCYL